MENWQIALYGFLGVLVGGLITFHVERWSIIYENKRKAYENFIEKWGTLAGLTSHLTPSGSINPALLDGKKISTDVLFLYASKKVMKCIGTYNNHIKKVIDGIADGTINTPEESKKVAKTQLELWGKIMESLKEDLKR
jgi:hypothetical protein